MQEAYKRVATVFRRRFNYAFKDHRLEVRDDQRFAWDVNANPELNKDPAGGGVRAGKDYPIFGEQCFFEGGRQGNPAFQASDFPSFATGDRGQQD
jgi:hypothetical protein